MAKFGPEIFKTKTGKKVTIRHCEPMDVDSYLLLLPNIAAETTHTLQVIGRTPNADKLRESWQSAIEHSTRLNLGVFSSDKCVGNLIFGPLHDGRHPWTKHIGDFGMYLLKDFWGEGLGQKLLETMEIHARNFEISRIEATARTINERGMKLYSRMGYKIEGIRKNAALINGEWHDEYYIAKLLDQQPSASQSFPENT